MFLSLALGPVNDGIEVNVGSSDVSSQCGPVNHGLVVQSVVLWSVLKELFRVEGVFE